MINHRLDDGKAHLKEAGLAGSHLVRGGIAISIKLSEDMPFVPLLQCWGEKKVVEKSFLLDASRPVFNLPA
jgi:hypothetical protein